MAPATDELDDAHGDEIEPKRLVETRLGAVVAGTYRIKRHIGSGGSSHVFEAEHVRLAKSFALKLLRPELDATRLTAQRFRREARAIAKLQNEHIVSVVDCGELDDGTPYLVMELLEGEDLRSLLQREGTLPARRAVSIIIEACRGLTAVHAAGLVHRDLKPENLFITRRATGEDWCKVLDFGVAKMEASSSTAQGAIIGTVRYMAPEQLADGAAVGPATDVYALGAILYECLSGQPLVGGGNVQEVMYRVMNAAPVSLRELMPSAPSAVVGIVDVCVSKSISKRPPSATKLAEMLYGTVTASPSVSNDTLPEDAPPSPLPSAVRSRRGGRVGVAAAAWGVALAGGVCGWLMRGTPSPSEQSRTPQASAAPILGTATASIVAESPPQSLVPTGAPAVAPTTSESAKASPNIARVRPSQPATPPPRAEPDSAGRFDNTNPYGQ